MGLTCSHGAFNGPYSYFSKWRHYLAEIAGLPPLELMEGYYHNLNDLLSFPLPTLFHTDKDNLWRIEAINKSLPIQWKSLKYTPLFILLKHSECNEEISVRRCWRLKLALENLLPYMDDKEWISVTERFINGLILAYKSNEPLKFG